MAVVLDSYRDDPVGFVEEVLGDAPYAKQREMLEAVVHNRRVSVVGANGSGKDWAAARAVLWWLATRPRATVVVTGPTQRQVEEIVWRELRTAYKASSVPLGGRVSGSHWNIDDDRFAIGFSTNRPENLQGFHSPELLVVVTEAHAVPQGHMEALKRLIPARMLLTGNAFSRDGEFFDSHHTKRFLYTRVAISAFDTPNFTGENGGIPGTPPRRTSRSASWTGARTTPSTRAPSSLASRTCWTTPSSAAPSSSRPSPAGSSTTRRDQLLVIPNRAQLPYLVIPSGAQRSRGISQVTFRCAPTHPPRDVSAALNMTKQGIRVIPNRAQLPYIPNRAQLPYLVIPSGAQRSRGISQVTFRCAPTHPLRDVSAALNMTMPSLPPPPAAWAWTSRASAPTRRRSACARAGSSSRCGRSSVSTRCAPRARR